MAIERLLKNLENWDKDERYMACSDMIVELQKGLKIDAATELRICTAILGRLDDKSNDVQSKAIQCLGILLKKVQHSQVLEICSKLCTLILDVEKDDLRDIYSIGLKTLVADVPELSGREVAQHLVGRLLNGVSGDRLDIKLECLDCLGDLLRRFGQEIGSDHQAVVMVLLDQLLGRHTSLAGTGGATLSLPQNKAAQKKSNRVPRRCCSRLE
jgi:cullin-associated NEDD8-dissociated protein 1